MVRSNNTFKINTSIGYTEWLVNDASGNTMAIYKIANGSSTLILSQQDIYGSSRLGVFYRDIDADTASLAGFNKALLFYCSIQTRV